MKVFDQAKIIELAWHVREKLIEVERIPHGNCYEASAALGFKLSKLGIDVSFVCGTVSLPRGQRAAHYWLEVEGLILDITGDQFNTVRVDIPPVFLASYEHYPAYLVRDKGPIPPEVQWQFARWTHNVSYV